MAKKKNEQNKEEPEYKFNARDFYKLLETQNFNCPLTGRKLTPENTTAEHKKPLRSGGKHDKGNIYLVDKEVAKIKRFLTEEQVVKLAADIIKTRGKEFGYEISKSKK